MSKVTKTDLPSGSGLYARVGPSDFLDCYCVASDISPRQAANIIVQFPGWARFFLLVRKVVTAPFGLSNHGPAAADKIGVFPVESDTGRELIAGFDDKHLDFRISVMNRNGHVFLATWVHPHNIGGRLYLALILPLHVAISRNALTRVGNEVVMPPGSRSA